MGCPLKRAIKREYQFGSLGKLLRPDNNDADLMVDFEQVMEILNKTNGTVGLPSCFPAILDDFAQARLWDSLGWTIAMGPLSSRLSASLES